jgi:hypothetical protein
VNILEDVVGFGGSAFGIDQRSNQRLCHDGVFIDFATCAIAGDRTFDDDELLRQVAGMMPAGTLEL